MLQSAEPGLHTTAGCLHQWRTRHICLTEGGIFQTFKQTPQACLEDATVALAVRCEGYIEQHILKDQQPICHHQKSRVETIQQQPVLKLLILVKRIMT